MPVNETVPLGTDHVTVLDGYIRENRREINDLWEVVGAMGGASIYNDVEMANGQTELVGNTDVSTYGTETIGLTAVAAVNLTTMTGCIAGAIKVIIALDANVAIIQNTGSTSGGTFYMNSPSGVNLDLAIRDVIAFVNVGGDGVTLSGYWVELWRKLQV
jgi:hypothetical protein